MKEKFWLNLHNRLLMGGVFSEKQPGFRPMGLCGVLIWDAEDSRKRRRELEMFEPIKRDLVEYKNEINLNDERAGFEKGIGSYGEPRFWASGDNEPHTGEYTDFRQTIVLLLAAMNDELED